jgi:hypothetical protein
VVDADLTLVSAQAFSAQAPGKIVVLDEKDFKKYFPGT